MSTDAIAAPVAANDPPAFKGLEGVEEFVNSRALEILREWINEPEMLDILRQAGMMQAADSERKEAA